MNRKLNRHCRRWLSSAILTFIVFELPLTSQSSTAFNIQVLKGSGSQNSISELAAPITVRVVGRNQQRLSGATVVFTAPTSGPSGSFLNGSNSVIVFTDHDGLAVAPEYRANSIAGAYRLQVRAAYMGDVATVSIGQENIVAKKSSRKMIMITAIAGGAAVAALAAKGGGGQSTSPGPGPATGNAPTIVFGGSSVGAPR